MILYIIGVILGLNAVIEVLRKRGDFFMKLVFIFLLLLTSWVGLLVYYFYARQRLSRWIK